MIGLGLGLRLARSASQVTTPLTIVGTAAVEWWRSDLGITVATGVSSWVGQKAGLSLAQATGANQPTFSASDANYNGRPSLTGNGTSQFLATASNLTLGTNTFFVWWVGRQLAGAANNDWLACNSVGTQFEVRGLGATNGQPQIVNSLTAQFGAQWGSSTIGATKAIYAYTSGTTTGINVSNGTEVNATVTSSTFANATFALFGRAGSLLINASAAEILVCKSLPSPAQLASLESYAKTLYGATV